MDIERIFYILVLITPLVIIPKMQVGWEVGKVFWFWTVVEAWLGYRLIKKSKFIWTGQIATMAIWLGVVLLSSVLAGRDAYWGGWWRRQGFWFMAHLGLLFYLISTSQISRGFVQKLIILVGLSSLAVAILIGGRLSGALLEPNNFGVLAMIVVILSFEKKLWAPLIVAAIGVVFTSSRSALLMGVVFVNRIPKKWLLPLLIFASAFLALVSWVRGGGERLELWKQTLHLWSTKPWLGIGLDNFQTDFSVQMLNKGLQWTRYDQPHNLLLWLLVSTGSLGLASFVGWLVVVFMKAQQKIWLQIALAIFVFSLFQPLSISVWVYLFTALALAQ